MGELTSRQQRVRQKLETRPEALNERDADALASLIYHNDTEISRQTLAKFRDAIGAGSDLSPTTLGTLAEPVRAQLSDSRTAVRLEAIETAGRLAHCYRDSAHPLDEVPDGYTYFGAIRAELDAAEPIVRRRVVCVLGRIVASYPSSSIPDSFQSELMDIVETDEPMVAAMAAQALGHTGKRSASGPACDVLVTALYDSDPWVRVGALRGLQTLGVADPATVEADVDEVVDAIFADHDAVQKEAAATLSRWATATTIDCDSAFEQIAVSTVDGTRGSDELVSIIRRFLEAGVPADTFPVADIGTALNDPDANVRARAAAVIGRIGEQQPSEVAEWVTELESALHDPAPAVRTEAVGAIGVLGQQAPPLVGTQLQSVCALAATDDERQVRRNARQAIGHIGSTDPAAVADCIEGLLTKAQTAEERLQDRAAEALDSIADVDGSVLAGSADKLTQVALEYDPSRAGPLAEALGRIAEDDPAAIAESVDRLLGILTSGGENKQVPAAGLLGRIGAANPSVVAGDIAVLAQALESDRPAVREVTVLAFGVIGESDPDVVADQVAAIAEMINDTESEVRESALVALGRIGEADPSVVIGQINAIAWALDDTESAVRSAAVSALGDIGGRSPSAVAEHVPTLTAKLSASDYSARSSAVDALRTIARRDASVLSDEVDSLVEFALDSDRSVSNHHVIKILQEVGSAEPAALAPYVDELTAAIQDENGQQITTATILGAVGQADPSAVFRSVEPLLAAARYGHDGLRGSAIKALGKIGGADLSTIDQHIDQLSKSLADQNPTVRARTVSAFGQIAAVDASLVADHIETSLLDDEDRYVREQTIEVLGTIHETKPDSELIASLRDVDNDLLLPAVQSMYRSGWEPSLAARVALQGETTVTPLIHDIVEVTSYSPQWTKPLVSDFRSALDQSSSDLQAAACRALGHLGDDDTRNRVAELAEQSDDESVQAAAREALDRLESPVETVDEPAGMTSFSPDSAREPTNDSAPPSTVPTAEPLSTDRSVIEVRDEITDDVHTIARVFEGTDQDSGRPVALKELSTGEGETMTHAIEIMRNEAEVWTRLQERHGIHDHVVRLYDHGRDRGIPWLAMEYMDGGSLRDRMADETAVSIPERVWICARVADALCFAHRHRLHHYDIKPANILFRETGEEAWLVPKLADWGVAEVGLSADTLANYGIHTPAYAAPEQVTPEDYGSRSQQTDIYQFSVVAYELLTGRHPFRDEFGRLSTGFDESPAPPSTIIDSLPKSLDQTLLSGLAAKPVDRPDSMSAVRNSFQQCFDRLDR
jgi:HEAT repeat protein